MLVYGVLAMGFSAYVFLGWSMGELKATLQGPVVHALERFLRIDSGVGMVGAVGGGLMTFAGGVTILLVRTIGQSTSQLGLVLIIASSILGIGGTLVAAFLTFLEGSWRLADAVSFLALFVIWVVLVAVPGLWLYRHLKTHSQGI